MNLGLAGVLHGRDGIRAEAGKLLCLCAGTLLYALSLNLFLVKNEIAAGGFAGIATVLNSVVEVPIGVMVIIMNVPFLVLSVKVKGIPFTVKTLLAVFIYSFFVDSLSFLPTLTSNKLLAAIFGGFMYGAGVVFAVVSDSSAGGTDLLNRLLVAKFKSSSIGSMLLLVDGLVVVLAMLVYGEIEAGLYAILTLYICAAVADSGLARLDRANICFIVSGKEPRMLASLIMDRMKREAADISDAGMFADEGRNVLIVAVKPKETHKIKEIVSA
jgi:uncharacterized membrane-anchored protein YitT (DUF2179 family)